VNRLGVVYLPNGIRMEHWTPLAVGALTDLPVILKPLEAYRDRVTRAPCSADRKPSCAIQKGAACHADVSGIVQSHGSVLPRGIYPERGFSDRLLGVSCRVRRAIATLTVGCLLSLVAAPFAAADLRVQLPNLDNQLVDPFAASKNAKAVVFVFVSAECPVSNRYAPELRRLRGQLEPRGVRFWLVFPNPAEDAAGIRTHLTEFDYGIPALRDPRQELVKLTGATMTPEAAVYDGGGRRVYRGRIDNRYVRLGLERPVPTEHDLLDAATAVLDGRSVSSGSAPAVGCYISDFTHGH
jgi:hypothetical protein